MIDDRINREERLEFILTPSEITTAVHNWILENSKMVASDDICIIKIQPNDDGTVNSADVVVIKKGGSNGK